MMAFWKDRSERPSRHEDPEAAIAEYLEALRQADVNGARPSPRVLNGLGDAHLDLEDVASAVEYFRQAAEAYAEQGHYDRAIACCQKVRRYVPEDPSVGLQLARYYAARGLRADAIAELEFVIEEQRAGNLQLAIEAARAMSSTEPNTGKHHERLADLLLADGQRERAVEALRAALERYDELEEDGPAHRVRRRIEDLEASARSGAARKEAAPEEATRGGAMRAEAQGYMAESLWGEAIDVYRRMAAAGLCRAEDFGAWTESARQSGRAPNVIEALTATSRWNLEMGDPGAARRAAEEMLLIDPDNAAAAEILEWVGGESPQT